MNGDKAILTAGYTKQRAENREPRTSFYPRLGALASSTGVDFRVWSPKADCLEVELGEGDAHSMRRLDGGYFELHLEGVREGDLYRIRRDGGEAFPDPASRYQPEGVHGPSMVVDPHSFEWHDQDWNGIPRCDLVLYELHVGTFSPEGDFDGVRRRLPHLKKLGVTALELMPVADFPGRWSWGYDHAALFAPSRAYGRPDDLRRLVDEAHGLGLAVYLDVIYNHLGPDAAYVAAFGPMFTDRHSTPWGMAINLDDEGSEGVRGFFIDNALHWLREYHVDGLRLDATHALVDDSPMHFLEELRLAVESIDEGPRRLLIAEDSRNLNKLILPREKGGFGLDGVWADDFHHQVRHITAGDSESYFSHFAGMDARDLAETISNGWYYRGQPSRRSGKARGTETSELELDQFVICIQNHDQVGNRPLGNRLNQEIPPDVYRAASALLLFSPEIPLLFMGQEWAAETPFLYFSDHHEELGRLVTEGRKKEFEDFSAFKGEVPDPQHPDTFSRSRLDWEELDEGAHAGTLRLYRDLLAIRKMRAGSVQARAAGPYLLTLRQGPMELIVALRENQRVSIDGSPAIVLDTEDRRYTGTGDPPTISDTEIRFARAGAILLRDDSRREKN